MKTNPKQLASILHFWKGPLNKAAIDTRIKPPAPIKKRMDYETRSTVEEPNALPDYKRMANGELRRKAFEFSEDDNIKHPQPKRRDVCGKSWRRHCKKVRQCVRDNIVPPHYTGK